MPAKRTTIELDGELVRAAQAATGQPMQETIEHALRQLVAQDPDSAAARRQHIAEGFAQLADGIDIDVLLSEEAWR